MNKKLYLSILLSSGIILTGCSSSNEQKSTTATTTTNSTQQERKEDPDNKKFPADLACCPKPETTPVIQNISAEEVTAIQNNIKEKESYLVIDVRSEDEYERGHIKYAINMPKDDFKIGRIRDWGKDKIILYGNTVEEAKFIGEKLLADGFLHILVAPGVAEATYEYVTYTNLTGSEFQKVIDKGEDFFIDSRDEKDFNKAHAKNVVRVDYKNLSNILDVLPKEKDTDIYLYDYTGDRSVVIAEKLQELGYTDITISLDGTKESQFFFPIKNN